MNNILRRFTACTLTALLALSLSVLPAQAADDTATESTTPNTGPVIDEDSTEDQSPETVDVTLVTDHVRYLGGYPDGTVQPNKAVTRAEAAAILYRLLDDPESGTGSCSYTDVTDGQWYAGNVRALCRLGLFDDGETFRPNDAITRAELVDLLVRLAPDVRATASFSDVPANYWAADAIAKATSLGWIAGYEDGTFRPDNSLTRAEACAFINRVTEREGDTTQAEKLIGLGLFSDIDAGHWAAATIAEAAVAHTPASDGTNETWYDVDLASLTFNPGVHEIDGALYSVDRHGKLALSKTVGAYQADANGVLTQTASSYQVSYVPYISQIDNIYAWVGCEPVSALMGLKAFGYAQDTYVTTFLNNLPSSSSNPEWGFVGSPYIVDNNLRTTIYPAALAEYCNSYTGGDAVCADFRGASVEELRQELLAGNMVVAYETLWWEQPRYRNYWIDGQLQSLVYNNHAILVYGYDPARGYLVSDPYNYYNRGQVYQYWEDAATFDNIWNQRKVGMVMR